MYMDPQKLASLDPKLREAYQRVMGTTIPDPNPTPQPQPQPEPIPTPPPTVPPVQPPAEPPIPQPVPEPEPQPTIPQSEPASTPQVSNFVQMNSEVAATPGSANFATPAPMPQTQTMAVKKKNHLMPILAGVVILIFLVIYFLFWAKIFNFKLPFLP